MSLNVLCLACGSGGYVDRGSSPPWTLCRLCGRAWMPGFLHDSAVAPLSWWIEWDADRLGGCWRIFETDHEVDASFEVAATPRRSIALDLVQELLNLLARQRDAAELTPSESAT